MRKWIFSSLVAAVALFAVDALAQVSPTGPNTAEFPTNTFNRLVFTNVAGSTYVLNFMTGNIDIVVDSTASPNNNITYDSTYTFSSAVIQRNGSNFVLGSNISAQMLVTDTVGRIDPAAGLLSLTITMKVKFTGGIPGLPATCKTGSFSVTVDTTKTTTSPVYSGISYSTSDGSFQIVAQDFTIPQVTTTNCGLNWTGDLNNFLGASFVPGLWLNGDTTTVETGAQ